MDARKLATKTEFSATGRGNIGEGGDGSAEDVVRRLNDVEGEIKELQKKVRDLEDHRIKVDNDMWWIFRIAFVVLGGLIAIGVRLLTD